MRDSAPHRAPDEVDDERKICGRPIRAPHRPGNFRPEGGTCNCVSICSVRSAEGEEASSIYEARLLEPVLAA